jgi:hypothetical protein
MFQFFGLGLLIINKVSLIFMIRRPRNIILYLKNNIGEEKELKKMLEEVESGPSFINFFLTYVKISLKSASPQKIIISQFLDF